MRINRYHRVSISPVFCRQPVATVNTTKNVQFRSRFSRRNRDDEKFAKQVRHFVFYNFWSVTVWKLGAVGTLASIFFEPQITGTSGILTLAIAGTFFVAGLVLRQIAKRSTFFQQMWKLRGTRLKMKMASAPPGQVIKAAMAHSTTLKNILVAASLYTACARAIDAIDKYRHYEQQGRWMPILPYWLRGMIHLGEPLLGQKFPDFATVILVARREQIAEEMTKLLDYVYNGTYAWQAPSDALNTIKLRLRDALKHVK